MRYRVSTLLLAMTLTAVVVASRRRLADDDIQRMLIVVGLWTAIGFSFGRTTAKWNNDRVSMWAAAAGGSVANWLCWYTWHLGVRIIRSPNSLLSELPTGLSWLLLASDNHVFLILATLSTIVLAAASWLRNERLLAAAITASLVSWFTVYWAAFLLTAAASSPPD